MESNLSGDAPCPIVSSTNAEFFFVFFFATLVQAQSNNIQRVIKLSYRCIYCSEDIVYQKFNIGRGS